MLTINAIDLENLIRLIYDRDDLPSTVLAITGESGIGKTEILTKTISSIPNYMAPRIVNVAHLNIEDMGLPIATDTEYTQFKLSSIFSVPVDPKKKVFIIWDELNRPNNDSVINFIMGAVSERRLFGVKIPDNIRFAATLNPNNESYPETRPIFDDLAARRRFNIISLGFDPIKFLSYSKKVGIDAELLDFLSQNKDLILVPGGINCPRQWHKFYNDILSTKKWTAREEEMMRIASSLYMDPATCNLWIQYWSGTLERYVTPEAILNSFDGISDILASHIESNRIDLLEASSRALTMFIRNAEKLHEGWISNLSRFIKAIPRPLSFVVISELVPDADSGDEYPLMSDIVRGFYQDDEILDLISSGLEKS